MARQAFKTILNAANLGVAVERDGLPYGGATDRSIVIQQVVGSSETFGGENIEPGLKGEFIEVHLQLDIWEGNRVTRDTLADSVMKLIASKRGELRTTYNIHSLNLVEIHDLPDPESGPEIYRKVLRYKMKTPLTRNA